LAPSLARRGGHGKAQSVVRFYSCRAVGGDYHHRHSHPLLLPAVQAAGKLPTEHCSNNLKQIGWPCTITTRHQSFPPAASAMAVLHPHVRRFEHQEPQRLLLLLPYLEQMSLYKNFNMKQCAANTMHGNEGCCAPTAAVGALAAMSSRAAMPGVSTPLAVFTCLRIPRPFLPAGDVHYGSSGHYFPRRQEQLRFQRWCTTRATLGRGRSAAARMFVRTAGRGWPCGTGLADGRHLRDDVRCVQRPLFGLGLPAWVMVASCGQLPESISGVGSLDHRTAGRQAAELGPRRKPPPGAPSS